MVLELLRGEGELFHRGHGHSVRHEPEAAWDEGDRQDCWDRRSAERKMEGNCPEEPPENRFPKAIGFSPAPVTQPAV